MNSIERVDAVLGGRMPDRAPVSFWYHFAAEQVAGEAGVRAHMDLLERFDLDFLKVMNDNEYPHAGRIQSVQELAGLGALKGDEAGFGAQLELIRTLKAAVEARGERVYMATTVFNAWGTLRLLIQPPHAHRPPNLDASADWASQWMREAHRARPELVGRALRTIGENLARFAGKCVEAGADGIFLSVREDWLVDATQPGLYEQLVRPTDLAILEGVREARFNMLHVCGRPVNLPAFGEYPVAVIHWADRAAGPAIREVKDVLKPALCGGVDNLGMLVSGTAEQVRAEVRDALAQAAPRPMLIAPGCTFDPARVPEVNLRAMVEAVRE